MQQRVAPETAVNPPLECLGSRAPSCIERHIDDLWWGSAAELLEVVEWSAFPMRRVEAGWLTRCPACVRGPLFVIEPYADHAALTCGFGCPGSLVRYRLAVIASLAFESLKEGIGR
jgi:hypothetical protein